MPDLTDERLAEMLNDMISLAEAAGVARWHDMPAGEEEADAIATSISEAFSRLRAENAELVAARTALVEGLRPFGLIASREPSREMAAFETVASVPADCRRAAELVARHGG